MKKILTLIIFMSLTIGANATTQIKPPDRYRIPSPVPVHVYYMDQMALRKACKVSWFVPGLLAGCAKLLPKHNPDRCSVFITKTTIANTGWPISGLSPVITPEDALDHELAHCAGWPSNHPF